MQILILILVFCVAPLIFPILIDLWDKKREKRECIRFLRTMRRNPEKYRLSLASLQDQGFTPDEALFRILWTELVNRQLGFHSERIKQLQTQLQPHREFRRTCDLLNTTKKNHPTPPSG